VRWCICGWCTLSWALWMRGEYGHDSCGFDSDDDEAEPLVAVCLLP
jgi:hypothetical protein